jgi:hypothetical protein
MRVQRGALPVEGLTDVDDRRDPLLDGFQHPQRFPDEAARWLPTSVNARFNR